MISDARNSGTETTNMDTRCGTTRDLDTTEPAPWQTFDSPRPETETDLERTRRGGRPSSAFEGSGGGSVTKLSNRKEVTIVLERTSLFNGTGNGGSRRGAGCRKALQRAVVQDGRKVSRSSSQEQEQSSPVKTPCPLSYPCPARNPLLHSPSSLRCMYILSQMHAANLAKAKVHLGNFNENRIPSTHAVSKRSYRRLRRRKINEAHEECRSFREHVLTSAPRNNQRSRRSVINVSQGNSARHVRTVRAATSTKSADFPRAAPRGRTTPGASGGGWTRRRCYYEQ
ncbi:LOW QUALITY PROTEIN: hypothetical protein V1478_000337 [Vespula squamosa]|uniref:Uncharacterized protein n=1 Tax=Vespula squamosa TaxID=30214 RepID=A0ABD2C575_VESSQ